MADNNSEPSIQRSSPLRGVDPNLPPFPNLNLSVVNEDDRKEDTLALPFELPTCVQLSSPKFNLQPSDLIENLITLKRDRRYDLPKVIHYLLLDINDAIMDIFTFKDEYPNHGVRYHLLKKLGASINRILKPIGDETLDTTVILQQAVIMPGSPSPNDPKTSTAPKIMDGTVKNTLEVNKIVDLSLISTPTFHSQNGGSIQIQSSPHVDAQEKMYPKNFDVGRFLSSAKNIPKFTFGSVDTPIWLSNFKTFCIQAMIPLYARPNVFLASMPEGSAKNEWCTKVLKADMSGYLSWSEVETLINDDCAANNSNGALFSKYLNINEEFDPNMTSFGAFKDLFKNRADAAHVDITGEKGYQAFMSALPKAFRDKILDTMNIANFGANNVVKQTFEKVSEIATVLWQNESTKSMVQTACASSKSKNTVNPKKKFCKNHPTYTNHTTAECRLNKNSAPSTNSSKDDKYMALQESMMKLQALVIAGGVTANTASSSSVVATPNSGATNPRRGMCDNCSESGHLSFNCPKPKNHEVTQKNLEARRSAIKPRTAIFKFELDHPPMIVNEFLDDVDDGEVSNHSVDFDNSRLSKFIVVDGLNVDVHPNEIVINVGISTKHNFVASNILSLVDSGSTHTSCSARYAKHAGLPMLPNDGSSMTYTMIDGTQHSFLGFAGPLCLHFNNKKFWISKIPVLPDYSDMSHLFTIGKDLFDRLGISMNIPGKNNIVKFSSSTYDTSLKKSISSLPRRLDPLGLMVDSIGVYDQLDNLDSVDCPVHLFSLSSSSTSNYYSAAANDILSLESGYPSAILDTVYPEDIEIQRLALIAELITPLLKFNAECTVSTPDKPCFINDPSARNIRVTHSADYIPQYINPHRLSELSKEVERKFIDELKAAGKVKLALPPYLANSPTMVSYITNYLGEIIKARCCIDFRVCNKHIIGDTYTLPYGPSFIDNFDYYKSEFDLSKGYFQFSIHPDDQWKLGIRTCDGEHIVFVGAPWGLKPLTSVCQRSLETIFADMCYVKIWVDGIFVTTSKEKGLRYHIECCAKVIHRCNEKTIALNQTKTKIAMTSMEIIGYLVTPQGVTIAPSKRAMVEAWLAPENFKQLAYQLGFADFLRRCIPLYTDIVRELQKLNALGYKKPAPKFATSWKPIHLDAFNKLKLAIQNAKTLCRFDPLKLLAIISDASDEAISGIIFHPASRGDLPNDSNIIDFFSRALRSYEKSYCVAKKETLGMMSTMVEFRPILLGREFDIHTDANVLVYLQDQVKLNRTVTNWYYIIAEFNIGKIYHVKGVDNIACDALSRLPQSTSWGVLNEDLTFDSSAIPADPVLEEAKFPLPKLSDKLVLRRFMLDDATLPIIPFVRFSKLRVTTPSNAEERQEIIDFAHSFGHWGIHGVMNRLKSQGYNWPGMHETVVKIIQSCDPCKHWSLHPRTLVPSVPINSSVPWDLVSIDLALSLPRTSDGYSNLLVVNCAFTKLVVLRPMKAGDSETVGATLVGIFSDLGVPLRVRSDNALALTSAYLKEFYSFTGVSLETIVPYSHHSNAHAERSIRTAVELIHKLCLALGNDWPILCPLVQCAINNKMVIVDDAIFSPFSLFFNREDAMFSKYPTLALPDNLNDNSLSIWVANLRTVVKDNLSFYRQLRELESLKVTMRYNDAHRVSTAGYFIPNDTEVMLFDPIRRSKTDPPYIGPYVIVENVSEDHYIIKDAVAANAIPYHRAVRSGELKLLKFAVQKLTEHGTWTLFVDFIIAKRINSDSSISYKVRWMGLDSSGDTWEPPSNIHDPSLITEYDARAEIIFRNAKAKRTPAVKAVNIIKDNLMSSDVVGPINNSPTTISLPSTSSAKLNTRTRIPSAKARSGK